MKDIEANGKIITLDLLFVALGERKPSMAALVFTNPVCKLSLCDNRMMQRIKESQTLPRL